MITLSAHDAPAELRAVALALRAADKEIRRDASQRMRATMNPVWTQAVSQHLTGTSRMEGRILTANARVKAGNPPVLVAAASRRRVGRGLVPDRNWPGYEYGASDRTAKMHSRKGKAYERHVMRHLTQRTRKGRVLEPAVVAVLPRIAAFYAQSVIRAYMDALDRRS